MLTGSGRPADCTCPPLCVSPFLYSKRPGGKNVTDSQEGERDMKSMIERRIVTLAAALAIGACDGSAGMTEVEDVETSQGEQPDEAEYFSASKETLNAVGVNQWRVVAGPSDLEASTLVITGIAADGKNPVDATLTVHYGQEEEAGNRDIVTFELAVKQPEAVSSQLTTEGMTVLPSVKSPLTTAISNDVVGALLRRMHGEAPEARLENEQLRDEDDVELGMHQQALDAAQRQERRALIKKMVDFASRAYVTRNAQGVFPGVGDMHGYKFAPQASTNVMKFYYQPGTQQVTLLFAFSGTKSLGDWGRDFEAQLPVYNYNPLSGSRKIHTTAHGFQTRWVNQAQNKNAGDTPQDGWTVLRRLQDAVADVGPNGIVRVIVVGHSLGGAAAELAGYSIAEWLKGQPVRQKVWVYAFNTPRIGFHTNPLRNSLSWYQDALVEGGACADPGEYQVGYGRGKRCLILRQFSRKLDPIASMPGNVGIVQAKSAVWQTKSVNTKAGTGRMDRNLPYCPMFYAPAHLNPHSLGAWHNDIDRNLSDAHLDCMYRRM